MKKIINSLMLMITLLFLTSCISDKNSFYSKEGFVLGTIVDITIYSKNKVEDEVFNEIFDELSGIEDRMTINKQINSEVEQINKMAGISEVTVSEDTFYVIQTGLEYSKLSHNRFDITVGPLVKLWNIGFDNARVPDSQDIKDAIGLIDSKQVTINPQNLTVKLEKKGMIIDLGGIAKGYAADAVAKKVEALGYKNALINLGGNILCYGSKPDGNPFKIGIRDPYGSSEDYVGVVAQKDMSIVTSGIYERNFIQDDILYHHILDTSSGYPVDNGLASVTIITPISIQADALSTAVFAMGVDEGMKFVQGLKDVEAVFITKDKKIYLTEGAENIFNLTNKDYVIVKP